MSEPNDGSAAGPSSVPKAVPSLAKKQGDVTRLGTQKMKFVPTLPARRKKEEVKQEEAPAPKLKPADGGRGRGRGRGRGGPPPPRREVEMTASGPFAMGPAMSGTSARRSAPRSNFAPIVPGTSLGKLTGEDAPTLFKKKKTEEREDDGEAYSDPDEGVEIVDMEDVKRMDWMAPESLRRERDPKKKKGKGKGKTRVKKEGEKVAVKNEDMDASIPEPESEKVNLANAVDLSASSSEEELEDLIDDFALTLDDADMDLDVRQERLYFFQFPAPFPTFAPPPKPKPEPSGSDAPMDVDAPPEAAEAPKDKGKGKAVSFSGDTKPPAPATKTEDTKDGVKEEIKARTVTDGVIGQLEVHRSGAVKMRLGNGIVLDVTAATHPSFLTHAVHLDRAKQRLYVLGEVNKRFAVSPDVDLLLEDGDQALKDEKNAALGMDGLIAMED